LLADINRLKSETETELQTLNELKKEEEGQYKSDPLERIQRRQHSIGLIRSFADLNGAFWSGGKDASEG
jgi:hypothetical protein